MHIYYLSKISLYIPSPTFLSSFTSPKEGVTKYLKPSGNLKPEARPNERNLRRKRTDGRNRASHRSIAPLPRLRPPLPRPRPRPRPDPRKRGRIDNLEGQFRGAFALRSPRPVGGSESGRRPLSSPFPVPGLGG